MENQFEKFNQVDRNIFTRKMVNELESLMALLDLSTEALSQKIGMDKGEFEKVIHQEKELGWSEYLAILFLFWRNDKGRQAVEEKGLFPNELKQMMSANQKEHD